MVYTEEFNTRLWCAMSGILPILASLEVKVRQSLLQEQQTQCSPAQENQEAESKDRQDGFLAPSVETGQRAVALRYILLSYVSALAALPNNSPKGSLRNFS